jgi:glycosyltransferase involved in cell wall biosynthesis
MHYGLPLALQRAGMLERVFCDWYSAGPAERAAAWAVSKVRPDLARKMRGRFVAELDVRKVVRNPWPLLRLLRRSGGVGQKGFEWYSTQMMRWVMKAGFGSANIGMGVIRNIHPQLCAHWRRSGLVVIGDQMIAPAAVEEAESALQRERFPGWQSEAVENLAAMEHFERSTWENMDLVSCASEYVKRGLIAQGVAPERIPLIPYPIDAGKVAMVERQPGRSPVTVGFVGAVGLRKGAPYFLEVARRLASERLKFVMVGPVQLRADIVARYQDAVQMVGMVSRGEIAQWLARFDVFFFPTTCEGSAASLMEAMASGLPLVTSPNSGTVARDGVEGYIAAYDDLDTISARISHLAENEELRRSMGQAGRQKVEEFNLDWYSREMARMLRQYCPARTPTL